MPDDSGNLPYNVLADIVGLSKASAEDPGTDYFAGGEGTEESPFLIATATHLANTELFDAHFKLINDIDLTFVENWQPVGRFTRNQSFRGTLDGGGHRIINLKITDDADYVGLFQRIHRNAVIQDLIIENPRVIARDSNNVGSLAGHNEGTIINVSVRGGEIIGNNNVGGIVGNLSEGTISISNSHAKVEGSEQVGGLIGLSDSLRPINNVYSSNTVTGKSSVGGLVGASNGSLYLVDVYSTADVIGEVGVGGLIGTLNDTTSASYFIENFYSVGSVRGDSHVGGLIGVASTATMQSGFALNPNVEGTDFVGRAIGFGSPEYYDIFAYDGTQINDTNGSYYYYNGLIDIVALLRQDFYETYGFSFGSIWNIDEGETLPYFSFSSEKIGFDGYEFTPKEPLFAGGNGTEENPYLISTEVHLKNIDTDLSAHYKLISDIDLSSIENWAPIEFFNGTLDGNGFSILNLTIDRSRETGLFENVMQNGVIKNLTLKNVDVKSTGVYTGALASRVWGGTIENVHVESGQIIGSEYTGGLVGEFQGSMKGIQQGDGRRIWKHRRINWVR